MPRQDIYMDAVYGELALADNLSGKKFYELVLLDRLEGVGADNDNYRYGEVIVPVGSEKKYTPTDGIYVSIPYTPDDRTLLLLFREQGINGTGSYIRNKVINQDYFPVFRETEYDTLTGISLSGLYELSGQGIYNLVLRDWYAGIYSGEDTDMQIKAALPQNETFLLKAFAGNLYQHPLTGVGLTDYLHANFENTGLADKLQAEFEADNMVIQNAYMDSATGELLLEVEERSHE